MPSEITIKRPDDWHLHLRDGAILGEVAPYTTAHFARAIVMPNLVPPVVDAASAVAYRSRILAASGDSGFQPLMTAYLTDQSDADELVNAFHDGVIAAVKMYPAGATTNADRGVTDVKNIYPVLEKMQETSMPLLVHGEVVGDQYDIFDREKIFLDTILSPLHETFPSLKVVLEHITTKQSVEFVNAGLDNIAATVTPHHLMINRSTMFKGGIRPHLYCLPIAKRHEHQLALRDAATSGSAKFFLGTDSAPHPEHDKHSACGCAGIFNAGTALACYAQVFEEEDRLENLEGFTSIHGPTFYELPVNEDTLSLRRLDQPLATPPPVGTQKIHQFLPDSPVYWQVVSVAQ